MNETFFCRLFQLPLCEKDSVIHELSRSEFRSKGFIVSQKCRCPPKKRCPIKDIAYKYNGMSRVSYHFPQQKYESLKNFLFFRAPCTF